MKNRKLKQSFKNAFNGIKLGVAAERNMKIHLAAGLVIALMGIVLGIDAVRWAILALTIAVVIAAELINTAIENVVDMITTEYSEKAKLIKDTAAASVLVVSIMSAAVGLLVLGPPLITFLSALI